MAYTTYYTLNLNDPTCTVTDNYQTIYRSINCFKLRDDYQYFEVSAIEYWEHTIDILTKYDSFTSILNGNNVKRIVHLGFNKYIAGGRGIWMCYYPKNSSSFTAIESPENANNQYTRVGVLINKYRMLYYTPQNTTYIGRDLAYLDFPSKFRNNEFFYIENAFHNNLDNVGSNETLYLDESTWQYKSAVESNGYSVSRLEIFDKEFDDLDLKTY